MLQHLLLLSRAFPCYTQNHRLFGCPVLACILCMAAELSKPDEAFQVLFDASLNLGYAEASAAAFVCISLLYAESVCICFCFADSKAS